MIEKSSGTINSALIAPVNSLPHNCSSNSSSLCFDKFNMFSITAAWSWRFWFRIITTFHIRFSHSNHLFLSSIIAFARSLFSLSRVFSTVSLSLPVWSIINLTSSSFRTASSFLSSLVSLSLVSPETW